MTDVAALPLKKLEIENWPKGISFQPHGIYVHKETGTLYAISHALHQGGERIEVFDVVVNSEDIPIKLKYKHSITSDWLN